MSHNKGQEVRDSGRGNSKCIKAQTSKTKQSAMYSSTKKETLQ